MSRKYQPSARSNRRPQRKFQKRYEEKGIILDTITSANARRRDIAKGEVRAHIIGSTWFTLLEVSVVDNANIMVMDTVSLNKDDEESKISKIVNRITADKLTTIGSKSLGKAIEMILIEEEKRFITWINQAEAINIRLHKLQLIKGIGPKFMQIILDERKVVPFVGYEDFEERTKISGIQGLIKQRIMDEITDDTIKYHLFTRSNPKQHHKETRRY